MPHRLVLPLLALLTLALPAHAGLFSNVSVSIGGTKNIEGSGHSVTQTRQTGSFDAVQVLGPFDLEISIGPALSVSVETDDNLQAVVRTAVHDGTLVIDSAGSWSGSDNPRVRVVLPSLTAVAVDSSGDAELKQLNGGDLALRVNGSGDVQAEGRVDSLSVLINGSGDAKLEDLHAGDARVRINGSGDASVTVSGKLEAIVNGSGDIRYGGGAHVSPSIHGSGSVEKR